MNDHAHSSAAPDVPADLIAKHRDGWRAFTRATVLACVFVAGTLLLMLLVFKVL